MLTSPSQEGKGPKRRISTSTPAKPSRSAAPSQAPPLSASDDLNALIAKRAYERYAEQGYRHGCALDDWLEAEREILSQAHPV
ncbi:MAG: DUF2934 domain-containing protein [Nitrospira defluvii]|nr:DUF2934 domain-containing protein [Nitrospira defluvii]